MTLRRWAAIVAVFVAGVASGVGGAWVARGQDRAVTVGGYEISAR